MAYADAERRLFAAFGAEVRSLRKHAGLSQDALAERADLHRTYVTEVELGRRNVSLYNVHRIANALGVSMAELIAGAETRHQSSVHVEATPTKHR